MAYDAGLMSSTIEQRLRRLMLLLAAIGLTGLVVELAAIGHYEEPWQVAPLVVVGASLAAMLGHVLRPGAIGVVILRAAMALVVLVGLTGVLMHYQGTVEFQLEVSPDLSGWPLLMKALHAKSPPVLAPGAMAQLGLLGLVYTYRHPVFGRATPPPGERDS
jgi:hypothetical protein